jgi:type VI secretion system protein ImpC
MTGFEITAESRALAQETDGERPFHIAILGDFSARGAEDRALRPILVDRDNFDEVMRRLAPKLNLRIGSGQEVECEIAISELDDFHPGRLYESLGLFRRLRDLRRRLSAEATFAEAAAELGVEVSEPGAPQAGAAAPQPPAAALGRGSLLDQILEEPAGQPGDSRRPLPRDPLRAYVQKIVEPHTTRTPAKLQQELVRGVDETAAELMRGILHHPEFQALESAWRGLFFLVRRLETGEALKLFLLDISKDGLARDLRGTDDLRRTALYRVLVHDAVQLPGGEPWALLAGIYTFSPQPDDIELLARIGLLAKEAGAPFVAAASPLILGCASLHETPDPHEWQPLGEEAAEYWKFARTLPEAGYIGLVLPRFLARMPYGQRGEELETFRFEEMAGRPAHEDFLWANAAFAAALLLGQAFLAEGWQMRPGVVREIRNLPYYVYEEDGEPSPKPCAEVLLTENAAKTILERGLMPLVSYKGSDHVMLWQFRSIGDPPRKLAGRWE